MKRLIKKAGSNAVLVNTIGYGAERHDAGYRVQVISIKDNAYIIKSPFIMGPDQIEVNKEQIQLDQDALL
jgi:hypothetical protein